MTMFPKLRVETADRIGINVIMRLNAGVPPFDNVKRRRVLFVAGDQGQFMPAIAGNRVAFDWPIRRNLAVAHRLADAWVRLLAAEVVGMDAGCPYSSSVARPC
jgi:hypothetical protein